MSYHILQVIDQKIWDSFILTHAPYALFQSWSWGEVQRMSGTPLARYGMYEGKRLCAVFQVAQVRARRGWYLHIRHGPVVSGMTEKCMSYIIAHLRNMHEGKGYACIRLNPMYPDSPEFHRIARRTHMVPSAIHALDAERCWVLPIDMTKEKVLQGMRKTTRYEIRRAEKLGVTVRISTDIRDLRHFFRLYQETAHRHDFVPHSAIDKEFTQFSSEGNAVLLLGSYQKKVTASAVILFWGTQAIYHHGASILSKAPVSHAVQWAAIQEAQKRGKKLYNFWGIAPVDKLNHPWRGITLFKKGFGGHEVNFIHTQDIPLTPRYAINRVVDWYQKVRKGY